MISAGGGANLITTIVFTPIIARLYSQEAYGVVALFYAVIFLFGSIASFSFPSAIVIPKTEEESNSLVELCVALTSWIVVVSVPLVACLVYLSPKGLSWSWVILVPVGIWLVSLDAVLSNQTVRYKMFERVSLSTGLSGLVGKITAVGYPFILSAGSFGLIISNVVMLLVSNAIKLNTQLIGLRISLFDWKKHRDTFIRYIEYPMYIFPSNLLGRVSKDLPLYFFATAYDIGFVGSYSFALGILTIPNNLIGNSIGTVFLQRASQFKEDPEAIRNLVKKVHNSIFALAVIPISIVAVYGDQLFTFVFSEKWIEAGKYAGILSPYYFFMMLSIPMNSVYRVMGKERVALLITITIVMVKLLVLTASVWFMSKDMAIYMLSVAGVLVYMANTAVIFSILRIPFWRRLFIDLTTLILCICVFVLLRLIMF